MRRLFLQSLGGPRAGGLTDQVVALGDVDGHSTSSPPPSQRGRMHARDGTAWPAYFFTLPEARPWDFEPGASRSRTLRSPLRGSDKSPIGRGAGWDRSTSFPHRLDEKLRDGPLAVPLAVGGYHVPRAGFCRTTPEGGAVRLHSWSDMMCSSSATVRSSPSRRLTPLVSDGSIRTSFTRPRRGRTLERSRTEPRPAPFLLSGIASIEDGLRVVTIAVTRATRSS